VQGGSERRERDFERKQQEPREVLHQLTAKKEVGLSQPTKKEEGEETLRVVDTFPTMKRFQKKLRSGNKWTCGTVRLIRGQKYG